MHYTIHSACAFFAMCRSCRHYAAGTLLARQAYGLSSASSRSHRVLGRTMSSRRSPPRGNSGGFAFDVVADATAVLPPILDEDFVRVETGRQHTRDVDARYVGLHGLGAVTRHAGRFVHVDPDPPQERQVR